MTFKLKPEGCQGVGQVKGGEGESRREGHRDGGERSRCPGPGRRPVWPEVGDEQVVLLKGGSKRDGQGTD